MKLARSECENYSVSNTSPPQCDWSVGVWRWVGERALLAAEVRSGECWREQLRARIRWLVMNSQLTLNLFQECPAE